MPDIKKTDAITLTFKKVADRPGAMTVFGQSLNGPESTILLEAGVSFHIRSEGGQLVLSTRAGEPDRLTEGEECVDMLMRYNILGGIRDGERPRIYLRRLVEEVIRLQAFEVEREYTRYTSGVPLEDDADLVDANLKPISDSMDHPAMAGKHPFEIPPEIEQAGREAFQKAKADIQAGQAARGEPLSEDAQEKI